MSIKYLPSWATHSFLELGSTFRIVLSNISIVIDAILAIIDIFNSLTYGSIGLLKTLELKKPRKQNIREGANGQEGRHFMDDI